MVEREVIRRIIIEGQEFVNEISLTERPFFFEQKAKSITSMKLFISILTMSASDK